MPEPDPAAQSQPNAPPPPQDPRASIYGDFLRHCAPVVLPRPWTRFAAPSDLYSTPADPAAALAALRSRFSDEALLEARVAVRVTPTELALAPSLATPGATILPLRQAPEAVPFDLVSDEGCVSQRVLPVCAVLGDHPTRARCNRFSQTLFVAFSMADLAVLRLMGQAVALVTGLPRVRRRDLAVFAGCYRLRDEVAPGGNAARGSASWAGLAVPAPVLQAVGRGDFTPPELVFVGWSPATLCLEPPEALTALQHHFARLERYLRLELRTVSMWQPTPEDLRRIRFCLRDGLGQDVQEAFLASLEGSSSSLTPSGFLHGKASMNREPASMKVALARLCRVLDEANPDQASREQAWQSYQAAVQRDLIQPLASLAETDDPIQANLAVAATHIAHLTHARIAAMSERLSQSRLQAVAETDPALLQELRQLTALVDRLTKLGKEIRAGRRTEPEEPIPSTP